MERKNNQSSYEKQLITKVILCIALIIGGFLCFSLIPGNRDGYNSNIGDFFTTLCFILLGSGVVGLIFVIGLHFKREISRNSRKKQ